MMTMFRTFYEVTKDDSKWYSEEYVKELSKQIEALKSDKTRWISNFNAKVEVIGELMEKSEELLKKFKTLQTEKNKLYMECSELNKKLLASEQKLKKIKSACSETINTMNCSSGDNAYSGGRCVEAEKVLKIIQGAENE